MPEEKIRKILKISKEPISMETPIGDDDDSHPRRLIEDLATLAPTDAALFSSLRFITKDVLDTLTPREARSCGMRFGIEMNTTTRWKKSAVAVPTSHASVSVRSRLLHCASCSHPTASLDKLRSFDVGITDGRTIYRYRPSWLEQRRSPGRIEGSGPSSALA